MGIAAALDADRIAGCLLGGAVGDAIGLPREGLSARRAARMFGPAPMRHGLVFGRGMLSDDTDHACMTAQAFLASNGDTAKFANELAWRLRWWLAGLPAGVGLATARSILRLWLGFSPHRSGVYSAGNGPAMRSPILGVCLAHDPAKLRELIAASTRITHSDPKATRGALLAAISAAVLSEVALDRVEPLNSLEQINRAMPEIEEDDELHGIMQKLQRALASGATVPQFASDLGVGNGVSGYIYQTVPMALYSVLRLGPDFRQVIEHVVALGGDTDTTAAIAGGIAGAAFGCAAIPAEWLNGIVDRPRSVQWITRLADRLSSPGPAAPLPLAWPLLVPRNLLFLVVVLLHGFRRLLPPH